MDYLIYTVEHRSDATRLLSLSPSHCLGWNTPTSRRSDMSTCDFASGCQKNQPEDR